MDEYDVERMIRDESIRLRSELREAVRELREEIGQERVERQDADESIQNVLNARTEHLA
jgi:hypothetical protein